MTPKATLISLCGPLLLLLCAGCAPSHQRYYGCHVPCKYCAPAPLPYTEYHGGPCHSCAAAKYLSNSSPADVLHRQSE
jgi:hypothetical protein